MLAEPVLKLMPSMTPVNFFTAGGSSSGQPSSSWKPFLVSGASGHLSREPRKPSPSVSSSGQPSSSSMPLVFSGLQRALVLRVVDAVLVVVVVRAAVVVLEAVAVLGHVRAAVGVAGDAVGVGIDRRSAAA